MDIHPFKRWAEAHTDIFIDLVRIYLGVGLFVKGIFFMSHRDYLLQLLNDSGNLVIAPVTIAHYVIPVHMVGGILLAFGLLTRVAALAQLPILIGAMFWVYLPKIMAVEPRQNLEFSGLVLFLMLLILIFGPGRWSVDHYLSGREPNELHPQPAT
jgi:putative oxidoreductase